MYEYIKIILTRKRKDKIETLNYIENVEDRGNMPDYEYIKNLLNSIREIDLNLKLLEELEN